MTADTTPTVLFVCVHNAGRSQMAAAFLTHHAAGRIEVRSAGSEPADQLNPAVVEAMREVASPVPPCAPTRPPPTPCRPPEGASRSGWAPAARTCPANA